jgi:hypothetical protein
MKSSDLEKHVKNLIEHGVLPQDFIIDEILYENGSVDNAFGHAGKTVYQWDKNGIGYLSIGTKLICFRNEDEELTCADAFVFERRMNLNCNEGFDRGICRVCGCKANDPCWNPEHGFCCWEDNAHTICSHCWNENIENDMSTIHCVNSTGADEYQQYK